MNCSVNELTINLLASSLMDRSSTTTSSSTTSTSHDPPPPPPPPLKPRRVKIIVTVSNDLPTVIPRHQLLLNTKLQTQLRSTLQGKVQSVGWQKSPSSYCVRKQIKIVIERECAFCNTFESARLFVCLSVCVCACQTPK
jgi:hypothetical protein